MRVKRIIFAIYKREIHMQSKIRELFRGRIYGTEFLKLYEDMAQTYTQEAIMRVHQNITDRTVPISFPEINQMVASFNNELINRATWIREDYKENQGYSSPKLTRGCKKIIANCVNDYLRAVQLANSSYF